MQTNLAYQAYNQNNIGIESPEKLITMLYEGILRFIYRAKKAMDDEDIENKVLFLNKTNAIFFELINSLDMNQGAVSQYLNGLYARQIQLIAEANLKNDKAPLDEVIHVTRELLDAWRDATKEE
ncbi:flagellar protein FliS [Campylobacter hyointestinalis]|uniref:Flagellar protein FliS n=1 Tax=Campylobacter hyointestinalis subsp. hyointestinalis TaxID=91352 RepID=A0A9W5AR21_CAMHY|nr:flagellar export chaperone FliS [Campylobacter hyointestinalis]CUU79696.1 flagellar protein FliS [Campylobacter hyointestinalis subsp. hyointestinalis]CUU80354.1 flagellar protein FliS [Campylobacter hyointestinalis subsp. hyointestinalis]CUU80483.1 flagellar protein FliS [Campylobacter hyointestinalis subsp. hyointestinalis]CUU81465.1 flagellar protein FliS [Campylobacter hyointestinalis]CUU82355.1 flagellar protein FliS [Campylobacter hyointestinalis subsp. hyointestinalis]